ncbi:serine/threonine-protein kinase [Paraliomyxa miuraensis]|uniref:serine/threonine-protein kinase n=1 Tax=Paraliomyxa miuraensis TaxID=376150 RepID=UPI00225020E8|nr:serine/threonine-protein kinase [Paraliomyxa miuraensis]MCX4245386.1 serine/threonine-protein kinase [Paraliomyxa miuraensis]
MQLPSSDADEETRATVGSSEPMSANESTGGLPVDRWGDETKRLADDDVPMSPLPSPRLPSPRLPSVVERLEESLRIGRFSVIEKIGAGGMGVVYRAYDPRLGREVALKCLRSREMQAELRNRLVREAQAMAKLNHPNVVSVFDVLEPAPGEVVLAMEYVPGVNLRRWLGQRVRPWEDVLPMLVAAGRGLAAAHAQGLLHRDFKPSNVLVGEDGRPRVTDFGLAKLEGSSEVVQRSMHPLQTEPSSLERSTADDADPLTSAGAVLGTPAYMAPEQSGKRAIDARADQYAFCSSLWHAITGRLPFGSMGSDLTSIISAKEHGPPPWPRDQPLPRRLAQAITRGMAPRPEDRWSSMDELLEQLHWDSRARRRRWLTAGAIVVTATASSIALVTAHGDRAERCTGARAALQGTWDEGRRDAARTAIAGIGVAYADDTWEHLAPRLDGYAEAWIEMHRQACEATSVRGEQSAEVLDMRMACLERARIRLRAATEPLVRADAEVIERAHGLVDQLLPLSRCADVDALRTGVEQPSAEEAAAVHESEQALAEARALVDLGKVRDAQVALARADAALVDTTYEPIHTELQLTRGVVLEQAGAHEDAEQTLRDALHRAAAQGQWELLQESAFELVLVVGHSRGLDAEALRYGELAIGLAERSNDPARLGKSHAAVGVVHRFGGRNAEAEAEYRAALTVLEAGLPPDHPEIVRTRGLLATVLHLQGHRDEAIEEIRAVVTSLEGTLGKLHPEVLGARNNLAVMLISQQRLQEAEAELRTVVERRTLLAGPASEDVGTARDNLAHVLRSQGRLEHAVAEHRAALRILTAALGRDHVEVARSHNNLGAALQAGGQLSEAEAELRAAVAVWERLKGPDDPNTARARNNLGNVLLDQGKPGLAVEPLRQAWAVRSAEGSPPSERARTALALARALMQSGRDRKQALELARIADAAYADAGGAYADERRQAMEREDVRKLFEGHVPR